MWGRIVFLLYFASFVALPLHHTHDLGGGEEREVLFATGSPLERNEEWDGEGQVVRLTSLGLEFASILHRSLSCLLLVAFVGLNLPYDLEAGLR